MSDASTVSAPGPTVTPVSSRFWEAAGRGRLELQRCGDCGLLFHYPRTNCPRCWSATLAWEAVSGRGTVKTFTVIHRAGHPAWQRRTPFVAALIELAEGPTLLSNVVDVPPAEVTVGMPVRIVFRLVDGVTLPQFVPDARGESRETGPGSLDACRETETVRAGPEQ